MLHAAIFALQAISVPANPAFRPTAVLLPHVRYVVAADSGDGAAVLRELSVPPVTFTGSVRIEGVQPGSRGPERRPFGDTVRFEADGRVRLLLADGADRAPIAVEVAGSRGAAAGRIAIEAPRWPLGRTILVTIAPADLYETVSRGTGFGARDRIRVDDRGGFAFLADSTAGPTTVAIGFGRGTRGRIQADLASVVLVRDFGGEAGRERRTVGAITLVLDPARNEDGTAHAEIIFGVGNSESEAAQQARAASEEAGFTPRTPALRWRTPSSEADLLLRHLNAAAGWMFDWEVLNGERTLPASAARPALRATDAWRAATLALQRGDTAAVCGTFRLLRATAMPDGRTRAEIGLRLGGRGRYFGVSDSVVPAADAALVLLAHACYAATRNAALLRASFPALAAAATRAAQSAPADISFEAVRRLAELADELARTSAGGGPPGGDSLRAEAARLAAAAPARPAGELWRAVLAESQRGVGREYGRLSDGGEIGGVSLGAAGAFVDRMVREVFGVEQFFDRLEIAPRMGGIADDRTWELDGWLLGPNDTLGVAYKPADRAAIIRLSDGKRRRVVLRFPWLSANSCVIARRGPDSERVTLIAQVDGSFFVDVRATYDSAELRISAAGCS